MPIFSGTCEEWMKGALDRYGLRVASMAGSMGLVRLVGMRSLFHWMRAGVSGPSRGRFLPRDGGVAASAGVVVRIQERLCIVSTFRCGHHGRWIFFKQTNRLDLRFGFTILRRNASSLLSCAILLGVFDF